MKTAAGKQSINFSKAAPENRLEQLESALLSPQVTVAPELACTRLCYAASCQLRLLMTFRSVSQSFRAIKAEHKHQILSHCAGVAPIRAGLWAF